MNVSVEISLYPLADDYIPPILDFIRRLNEHPDLKVMTNTMSTQVFGPYERVFEVLGREMQETHRRTPKAAFAVKVLNGRRPSSLPPARPRKVVYAVNVRTAEHLKLRLPPELVDGAAEVFR